MKTIEILRRMIFAGGLLPGGVLAVWPVEAGGDGCCMPASRVVGLAAIAVALLAYVVLPRARPGPGEYRYSGFRAIVLPDWLGTLMAACFAVLPVLIVSENASSPWDIFDVGGGWIVLTACFWFMAACSLSIVGVALWYAVFVLRMGDGRLEYSSLCRHEVLPYAEIASMELTEYKPPRWMRILFLFAGVSQPTMAGVMILGATTSANGLLLRRKDGRTLTLWFDLLQSPGEIAQKLRDKGVEFVAPAAR